MKRYMSIIVLCLSLVGLSYAQDMKRPAAAAPNRPGQQFPGKQFAAQFVMRYGIQLTDAQKAQIKQIRQQNAPDPALLKELRAIMQSRRNGPLTDAQKARVKEIRDEIQAKQKATHEQVLAVFTADQKAQLQKNQQDLQQLRKDIRQRMQQFRQDHPMRLGVRPPIKVG